MSLVAHVSTYKYNNFSSDRYVQYNLVQLEEQYYPMSISLAQSEIAHEDLQ